MRTPATLNTTPPPSSSQQSLARVPHSPWHSPVPYLFGGLAAMLGLIAFALLILACSYWKLSGNFDQDDNAEGDLENGDEKNKDALKPPPVYEEKIVVIMAGDHKPTYLATPMSSRASSFGSTCSKASEKPEDLDKPKENNQRVESRAIAEPTNQVEETQLQDHQV